MNALPPLARVSVEGAIACAVGRDREDNSYDSSTAPEAYSCWRWSWQYADLLLAHVAEHEVQAWLKDQDAA